MEGNFENQYNSFEKGLDKIVREVFGSWDNLEKITLNLIKISKENNGNKPGSIPFVRELMGNYVNKVSAEDFKNCIKAVNIAVNRANKDPKKNIKNPDAKNNNAYNNIAKSAQEDLNKEALRAGYYDSGSYDEDGNKFLKGDGKDLEDSLTGNREE